eukprot:scaffold300309_cov36-Tisochrysis_lutea.AAC.2
MVLTDSCMFPPGFGEGAMPANQPVWVRSSVLAMEEGEPEEEKADEKAEKAEKAEKTPKEQGKTGDNQPPPSGFEWGPTF